MFKKNDKVQLKPEYAGKWGNTVFTVDKMLKVNLQVITPTGKQLRGVPELFMPASSELITTPPNSQAEVKDVPVTNLRIGEVVTVDNPLWKGGPGPFVVMKQSWGSNTVHLVKLGGDPHGRFWKNVPQFWCRKVDFDFGMIPTV